MSQTSHPTKYTYYKNGIGTYSICCPTKLGLNYVSLVFSNELLAVEVVEELNAAIEFGKKYVLHSLMWEYLIINY